VSGPVLPPISQHCAGLVSDARMQDDPRGESPQEDPERGAGHGLVPIRGVDDLSPGGLVDDHAGDRIQGGGVGEWLVALEYRRGRAVYRRGGRAPSSLILIDSRHRLDSSNLLFRTRRW